MNVQIRNNFENIIFIAWKWCTIYKYYVNSMVMSRSTCKKEQECTWVKWLICAVLPQYIYIFLITHFLRQILILRFLEFTKKSSIPSLGPGLRLTSLRYIKQSRWNIQNFDRIKRVVGFVQLQPPPILANFWPNSCQFAEVSLTLCWNHYLAHFSNHLIK